MKTKIVSCHTADSKPVKQEVNSTVILSPLVFPGSTNYYRHEFSTFFVDKSRRFHAVVAKTSTTSMITGSDFPRSVFRLTRYGSVRVAVKGGAGRGGGREEPRSVGGMLNSLLSSPSLYRPCQFKLRRSVTLKRASRQSA